MNDSKDLLYFLGNMELLNEILTGARSCEICKNSLPFPPRPVVQAGKDARIAIIGQAPGMKVQQSGVPWDDASGRELRSWLDLTPEQFYDKNKIAIIPMGFCYPGKGKSGDLPPRRECAPLWHEPLLEQLPNITLTLLIGKYAQDYYLANSAKNLTETVQNYAEYLPEYFPLVHPSPRNFIWQKKNPWFKDQVVPVLKASVAELVK